MSDLASAQSTIEWIAQFTGGHDQGLAKELVDSILTVSADKLTNNLHDKLAERIHAGKTPVAIYAEREIPKGSLLFEQKLDRPRSAFGKGPSPTSSSEVGSEGIVSNIITQLQRECRSLVLSHASPDDFRGRGIRRFIIATDFIGSGSQILSYLDAAWGVRSLQSWHSRRLLDFEVVAYAATGVGVERVKRHKCRPAIHCFTACPTVHEAFSKSKSNIMQDLCVRYNPGKSKPKDALGFGGGAALIAFSHGAPNNCPRILTSKAKGWNPLFPYRRTTIPRILFPQSEDEEARRALKRMSRESLSDWIGSRPQPVVKDRLLVMVALIRGARTDQAISARTQLPLTRVQEAIASIEKFGWINSRRLLTDDGRREIHHIEKVPDLSSDAFPADNPSWYFPKHLRAPR